jgi:hypothetical protein
MDTWGIDRTCYSITHMISSDFRAFSYNDGSPGGSGDTSMFAYVAYAVGDDFLRLVRNMHLQGNGSSGGIYDCLFYKPIDQNEKPEMPLQYHHVGIHGYTVRSSWDRGAIFAGLLGGDNDDGHGHIDAGQWIYYNKGIPFIEDMGADGYNTYNYFSNNHMYKTTVEGHSVMMLTSAQDKVPAGQLRTSVSPVIATGDNEFGAFAVVDTSPAYGGSAYMTSCERGMMITNDRNTVIIQDEVTPYGNHSMVWLAHYSTEYITNVEITGNGRIAYLTSKKNAQGENVVLRLAIVSSMPNIGFETGGAYDFLLDATMRPGDSEAMGKQPENDRSNWHKLMIKFENRININVAVVCEVVDPSDPIGTGYSFTPMDDWVPYADTRVKTGGGTVVENVVTRGKANTSDLIGYTERIGDLVSKGEHFEKLRDYYSALTQVTYTVNTVGRPKLEDNDKFLEYLEQYDEYYRMYDKYVTAVNKTAKAIFAITDLLTATKNKAADAGE